MPEVHQGNSWYIGQQPESKLKFSSCSSLSLILRPQDLRPLSQRYTGSSKLASWVSVTGCPSLRLTVDWSWDTTLLSTKDSWNGLQQFLCPWMDGWIANSAWVWELLFQKPTWNNQTPRFANGICFAVKQQVRKKTNQIKCVFLPGAGRDLVRTGLSPECASRFLLCACRGTACASEFCHKM